MPGYDDHIMSTMNDPWGGFTNDGHGASAGRGPTDKQVADAIASLGKSFKAKPKAKSKPAKRVGYRECVEYIAWNDDEGMLHDGDPSVVVSMVAHLFDKETDVVIADVLRYLEKRNG